MKNEPPGGANENPKLSSRFLADMIEHSGALISVKDCSGRYQLVNRVWEKVTGLRREEVLGRVDEDFFSPEEARRFRANDVEAMEFGAPIEREEQLAQKEGLRHFISVKFPLRDDQGGVNGVCGMTTEITEQKRAQERQREGEVRLRAVIEQAPFGAHSYELLAGDRLVLLAANQAADRILGIDHAPLIGRTIEETFPLLRDTEIPERYRRLATSDGSIEDQQVVYDHDEIRGAFAIHAFHTGVGRMTVFFRDVTERAKAEAALRSAEASYRSLFDNALEGIYRSTPEGVLLAANPAMAHMLGYATPAELIQHLGNGAHHGYVDAYAREDFRRRVEESGSVTALEVRVRRKDGRVIWVSENARVVRDAQGRVLYYEGSMEDITERKRAEAEHEKLQAQLLQAQKMESVGRLAGGVAHDFNNMLQAILGNAALALEELPPFSPVRESIEEIQRSARRSAELTRQLLTFARKQTIAPKVLDLNDTVAGMLKMLRRLIGEDLELSWLPGAGLWPVRMDPSQVDQILANLCVNARDAIAGAGKVTIETSNVTLDDTYTASHPEAVAGDYVMMAVSDTGQGMEAEVRAHLFEPFFTTKDVGKGTGLGLATVFGIVRQNAGLINVYSEPGCGTTFKVYIPRVTGAVPAEAFTPATRAGGGYETVLLVEDEEQILRLGRRILERLGYTVLTAATPEAALAAAERHPASIDLLITDVVMPSMNGRVLRDQLRQSRPAMGCLFMSGYTADVIAHHGVLDEGMDFLQKPFTTHALTEKVRAVLVRAKTGEPKS